MQEKSLKITFVGDSG